MLLLTVATAMCFRSTHARTFRGILQSLSLALQTLIQKYAYLLGKGLS